MEQFKDKQIQKCFETLPAFIQEMVIMSGVEIRSVEQLKSCAENIINQKGMQ